MPIQRQIFLGAMGDGRFSMTIALEDRTESTTIIMTRDEAEKLSASLLHTLQIKDQGTRQ